MNREQLSTSNNQSNSNPGTPGENFSEGTQQLDREDRSADAVSSAGLSTASSFALKGITISSVGSGSQSISTSFKSSVSINGASLNTNHSTAQGTSGEESEEENQSSESVNSADFAKQWLLRRQQQQQQQQQESDEEESDSEEENQQLRQQDLIRNIKLQQQREKEKEELDASSILSKYSSITLGNAKSNPNFSSSLSISGLRSSVSIASSSSVPISGGSSVSISGASSVSINDKSLLDESRANKLETDNSSAFSNIPAHLLKSLNIQISRNQNNNSRNSNYSNSTGNRSPDSRPDTPDSRTSLLENQEFRSHSPESRAQSPESRAQSAESRAQSAESRAQSAGSRAQSPESRSQSPESRAQSPESRAQSPESRAQSPESRAQSSKTSDSRALSTDFKSEFIERAEQFSESYDNQSLENYGDFEDYSNQSQNIGNNKEFNENWQESITEEHSASSGFEENSSSVSNKDYSSVISPRPVSKSPFEGFDEKEPGNLTEKLLVSKTLDEIKQEHFTDSNSSTDSKGAPCPKKRNKKEQFNNVKLSHKCTECLAQFENATKLRLHIAKHSKVITLSGKTPSESQTNLKSPHLYKCPHCPCYFTTQEQVSEHKVNNHPLKSSDLPSQNNQSVSSLEFKVKEKRPRIVKRCKKCSIKKFDSFRDFKNHHLAHIQYTHCSVSLKRYSQEELIRESYNLQDPKYKQSIAKKRGRKKKASYSQDSDFVVNSSNLKLKITTNPSRETTYREKKAQSLVNIGMSALLDQGAEEFVGEFDDLPDLQSAESSGGNQQELSEDPTTQENHQQNENQEEIPENQDQYSEQQEDLGDQENYQQQSTTASEDSYYSNENSNTDMTPNYSQNTEYNEENPDDPQPVQNEQNYSSYNDENSQGVGENTNDGQSQQKNNEFDNAFNDPNNLSFGTDAEAEQARPPSSYQPQFESFTGDWYQEYESGPRIAAALSGSGNENASEENNENNQCNSGLFTQEVIGSETVSSSDKQMSASNSHGQQQGGFEQLCLSDSFNQHDQSNNVSEPNRGDVNAPSLHSELDYLNQNNKNPNQSTSAEHSPQGSLSRPGSSNSSTHSGGQPTPPPDSSFRTLATSPSFGGQQSSPLQRISNDAPSLTSSPHIISSPHLVGSQMRNSPLLNSVAPQLTENNNSNEPPRLTIANNLMPVISSVPAPGTLQSNTVLPNNYQQHQPQRQPQQQQQQQQSWPPSIQSNFNTNFNAGAMNINNSRNIPMPYKTSHSGRSRGRPPIIGNAGRGQINRGVGRPSGSSILPPPLMPAPGGRGPPSLQRMPYSNNRHIPQMQGQKRPLAGVNQAGSSPNKAQRREDINVPSRQKDNECQIIAVANRSDGLPVISNVQGGREDNRRNSTGNTSNNNSSNGGSDSTIHLSDSITLSVRSTNSGSETNRTERTGENGNVTNLLASRGITVTPAAGEKNADNSREERRIPSASELNLSNAISVHPPTSRDRDGFAVPQIPGPKSTPSNNKSMDRPPRPPTVDLTREPPPPQQRAKCNQCDKTFPNQSLLADHAKVHQQQQSSRMPYKCHLCTAGFSSHKGQQHHYQQFHQLHLSSNDVAIPLVDLRNPVNVQRMAAWGIRSFLPLSNLQNRGGGGIVGIPLLTLESLRNGNMSMQQWGVSDVLTLGPAKTLNMPRIRSPGSGATANTGNRSQHQSIRPRMPTSLNRMSAPRMSGSNRMNIAPRMNNAVRMNSSARLNTPRFNASSSINNSSNLSLVQNINSSLNAALNPTSPLTSISHLTASSINSTSPLNVASLNIPSTINMNIAPSLNAPASMNIAPSLNAPSSMNVASALNISSSIDAAINNATSNISSSYPIPSSTNINSASSTNAANSMSFAPLNTVTSLNMNTFNNTQPLNTINSMNQQLVGLNVPLQNSQPQ